MLGKDATTELPPQPYMESEHLRCAKSNSTSSARGNNRPVCEHESTRSGCRVLLLAVGKELHKSLLAGYWLNEFWLIPRRAKNVFAFKT